MGVIVIMAMLVDFAVFLYACVVSGFINLLSGIMVWMVVRQSYKKTGQAEYAIGLCWKAGKFFLLPIMIATIMYNIRVLGYGFGAGLEVCGSSDYTRYYLIVAAVVMISFFQSALHAVMIHTLINDLGMGGIRFFERLKYLAAGHVFLWALGIAFVKMWKFFAGFACVCIG